MSLQVAGEFLEVMVQVVHHFALDFAGTLAQALEAGHCRRRLQAIPVKAKRGRAKSLLQMGIAQRLARPLVNLVALNSGLAHKFQCRASNSARCRVFRGERWR